MPLRADIEDLDAALFIGGMLEKLAAVENRVLAGPPRSEPTASLASDFGD